MNASNDETLSTALGRLCGESINSITFVEDYVQVEVAGGHMSILEPLQIEMQGRVFGADDLAFAEELNACVGASIRNIEVDHHQVFIQLSNSKALRFPIYEPTNSCETFIYQDETGRTWVVGPN